MLAELNYCRFRCFPPPPPRTEGENQTVFLSTGRDDRCPTNPPPPIDVLGDGGGGANRGRAFEMEMDFYFYFFSSCFEERDCGSQPYVFILFLPPSLAAGIGFLFINLFIYLWLVLFSSLRWLPCKSFSPPPPEVFRDSCIYGFLVR